VLDFSFAHDYSRRTYNIAIFLVGVDKFITSIFKEKEDRGTSKGVEEFLTPWQIHDKETIDEIIFRTAKPRNRLTLELMARGGLRAGEVLNLPWGSKFLQPGAVPVPWSHFASIKNLKGTKCFLLGDGAMHS
jgi:hypothetical protein